MGLEIVFIVVIALVVWSLGSTIRKGLRLKAQADQRSVTVEQMLQADKAERLRRAKEAWRLPPELSLLSPRLVQSAPASTRLLRSLPVLFRLTLSAIILYSVGFSVTHGTPVTGWRYASFLCDKFLDFLRTPQWQRWMLWPSVLFAGWNVLWGVLPGYLKRREERRLLQWGIPARAVVISASREFGTANPFSVRTSTETQGFKHIYRWFLEYADAAGDPVQSSFVTDSMPQPGQEVLTILHDPDNPQQFITYPVARYVIGKG